MSQIYPVYAIKRFGWRKGIVRALRHTVLPIITFDWLRWHIKRFIDKDRRPKRHAAVIKYAVNRDGDLFLIECPVCHSQTCYFNSQVFECCCGVNYKVYLEDGVVKIHDHRQGDVKLPSSVAWDPSSKCYRLGLNRDYPWWWDGRDLYQDFQNGKDAHGHKPYQIIEKEDTKEEIGQMEKTCG